MVVGGGALVDVALDAGVALVVLVDWVAAWAASSGSPARSASALTATKSATSDATMATPRTKRRRRSLELTTTSLPGAQPDAATRQTRSDGAVRRVVPRGRARRLHHVSGFVQPATPRLFTRAARLRCPVCGSGGLFRRWVDLAERCPRCRLRFERGEGEFIGAIGVNTIVSFGAILVATVIAAVFIAQGASAVGFLVGAVVVAVIVPLVFFPFSKTLWVAFTLVIDPLEDGEAPGIVTAEGASEQG